MTVDLGRRETGLLELMDDPRCDLTALRRTYGHFALVNRLVSGWSSIYRSKIRPFARAAGRPISILDIGSGGGDVARALAAWAAADGLDVPILAVDPDARAHEFATARPAPSTLQFARTTSRELVDAGARFDLVLSNHLLHHLDPAARDALFADTERLTTGFAVHNDIARSAAAYRGYALATNFTFPGSFIHVDGMRSIRRSYRVDELRDVLPRGWQAVERRPFRLLAVFDRTRVDA